MSPNKRIKVPACGTLTHGKKRRLSHAAAYPQRYTGKRLTCEVLGGSAEPPRNR